MKRFTLPVIISLLFLSCNLLAQEVILDGKFNRFLINEKTNKPRLDVIVQSYTDYEKKVISKSAVMDTVSKPKFEKVSGNQYAITASRMGEKLTFVVRDFEKLEAGYQIRFNEKPIDLLARSTDHYLLNGQKCLATQEVPFGAPNMKILLLDKNNNLISKLSIKFSYLKPELIYVDIIGVYNDIPLEDTAKLRRIVHRVNKVPTVYSQNNSVPDRVATDYRNNLFFGFKKVYYDGKFNLTSIFCKIDNRYWTETQLQMYPFTDVKTLAQEDKYTDFYMMRSGTHSIMASYIPDTQNFETYKFEMNRNSLDVGLHYLTLTGYFIMMILFSKPWILLILLGLVLFANWGNRMKKQREAAQKTNLELQTIQSQLNPHFVFNALGSVQGLINGNEIEKANTYLTDFSKLLRKSLNDSSKDMVPLSEELYALDRYIRLEQLRFNFDYNLHVDDAIETTSVEIPPFLIQPVIENAIKHGMSSLGDKGLLTLNFVQVKNDLIIEVVDNGKGFDARHMVGGKGISLTRERIKLLNKQKHKISMEIINPDGEGTLVRFILKHSFS